MGVDAAEVGEDEGVGYDGCIFWGDSVSFKEGLSECFCSGA